eukprot:5068041-Alexandrium_andersonii.AAC.1
MARRGSAYLISPVGAYFRKRLLPLRPRSLTCARPYLRRYAPTLMPTGARARSLARARARLRQTRSLVRSP